MLIDSGIHISVLNHLCIGIMLRRSQVQASCLVSESLLSTNQGKLSLGQQEHEAYGRAKEVTTTSDPLISAF